MGEDLSARSALDFFSDSCCWLDSAITGGRDEQTVWPIIYPTFPRAVWRALSSQIPFIGKIPVSGNQPRIPVPTPGSRAPTGLEEWKSGDGSGIPLTNVTEKQLARLISKSHTNQSPN
jgi:hypothetical protein